MPTTSRRRTYWILRSDQIAAVTSPLRQEIVDRLAAFGPEGVRELALALGRRPTSIYHHVRRLERVGLLSTVPGDGTLGRPSVRYATIAPRMRLARAARVPSNWKPLRRAAAAAASQSSRDYAKGFGAGHWKIEGAGRNHWFFRVVASPSRGRLREINTLLDRLAELVWAPDPRPGTPISVAWFLAPLAPKRRKRRRPRVGRNGP